MQAVLGWQPQALGLPCGTPLLCGTALNDGFGRSNTVSSAEPAPALHMSSFQNEEIAAVVHVMRCSQ
jgi:hypothetical protein